MSGRRSILAALVVAGVGLTAVPNYARLNRGGSSQVWLVEDPVRAGLDPLASRADLTVSFARGGMDPAAVNDGLAPRDEKDHAAPNFDFWPHKGTEEWLQYAFDRPVEVKACTVWWFDDTGRGECRLPDSWRLTYQKPDGAWAPVEVASAYPIAKGRPCEVTFRPVVASALRLAVRLPPAYSSGVFEWTVR